MKKILFATTALVATAGVAAAEVNISGWAEIGVIGGKRYGDVTQFHTDTDVDFNMSGEADNGLKFGASVDLDEASAFGTQDDFGVSYFIAFGGARLDMGDVDGGFDAAMKEVNIGGSIDDSETWHDGFSGNSGLDGTHEGQIATFSYNFDSFTGYLSNEIDDDGVDGPVWGLGARYGVELAGANIGVGIGYQQVDIKTGSNNTKGFDVGTTSIWGISLDTKLDSGIEARVNYSEQDMPGAAKNQTHLGLGFGYSMNALTVGVNYGKVENVGGVSTAEDTGYGLAVNYDLGGGLVVQFGYGHEENKRGATTTDGDSFSLGLAMSF